MIRNKIKKQIAAALIMTAGIGSLSALDVFASVLNVKPGQVVRVNSNVKAYVNSESANSGSSTGFKIYDASNYYVYKVADGATNISKIPGVPGGWVSNDEISVVSEEKETTTATTNATQATTNATLPKTELVASPTSGTITINSSIKVYGTASSAIASSGTYTNYGAAKYYVYKTVNGATNISTTPGVPGGWVSNKDLTSVTKVETTTKPQTTTTATKASTTPATTAKTTTTTPTTNTTSVTLLTSIRAYSNADLATNGSSNYVTYSAAKYYIYKTVNGATNISKTPGVPGAWVSNKDLESAKSGVTTIPKTPTTTTTTTKASSTLSTKESWMSQAGIPQSSWKYVDYIVTKESGWDYRISNSYSGAYGLPQAYPGYKMASAGSDWATNPVTQLKWMDSYVKERYGGWSGAYNFWINNNWY